MPDSEHGRRKSGASDGIALLQSPLGQLLTIIGWFGLPAERASGRLAVLELTDEQLKDVGLSREQFDGEIRRRPGHERADAISSRFPSGF